MNSIRINYKEQNIEEDFLILTEEDLVKNKNYKEEYVCDKNRCLATTKKGRKCKNRLYNEKYCKLHHKQFSLDKPEECPICMESLISVNSPLKCGHWIHKDCLLKWKEDTCPMCRKHIKFTKKERDEKRRIHHKKRRERNDEYSISPSILELIESLLRGVPENDRNDFLSGFLNVDVDNNSLSFDIQLFDENEDVNEFSVSDIEDFPDYSDII